MFNPNNRPALLALALVLPGCMSTQADTQAELTDGRSIAEELLAPWVSDDAPGVTVAISLDDKIVFAEAVGMANLEQPVALRTDSVFQVASVSKQFTAFATLLLVSEGKIALDDDIRRHLPELPAFETTVTVQHLLDHTGGLRERNTLAAMAGWLPDGIRTERQMMDLITRQDGVNFKAGQDVEYSNTGYALLAAMVSRVSGQSFASFMQARVFDPLEMSQTQFRSHRNAIVPGRASSYAPSQDGFSRILSTSETVGSTGLYTSALDLLKWAENYETQIVGNQTVFDLMAARATAENGQASTFAKGQEMRVYKNLETWSHGGTDDGYKSFLLRIPSEDFEVSIVSNRSNFDTAKLAFALTDAFLISAPSDRHESSEKWASATAEELQAFAGHYEIQPGVIFALQASEQGLLFSMRGAPQDGLEPLQQIGPREFLLNAETDLALVFDNPVNGQSQKVGYRIGLHGTIDAERVALAPFESTDLDLNDYVGLYESEELATRYELSVEDGALIAHHPRNEAFALSAYQTETFAGAGPLMKVSFVRADDGNVTGFTASASLAEGIRFRKIAE